MTSVEAALGTIARSEHPIQHDIPWPALVDMYPIKQLSAPWPSEEIPGYEAGHWAFEDENAGTHLIRNALCGGDKQLLKEMLSLKYGTRSFRDDCTVL